MDEDLEYDKILDGETLVKEVLEEGGTIRDTNGKSYYRNTIDRAKNYRVKKYVFRRALQYYPVISYTVDEIEKQV